MAGVAATLLVAMVALLHLWILVLEMFLWNTDFGRRAFGMDRETAAATSTLAANQGLYNGFLAAGLIWGLSAGEAGRDVTVFFLGCVIVAGIYGGFTAKKSILLIQALPGALALAAVLASGV